MKSLDEHFSAWPYILTILCIIPYFSSNIGIGIEGFKFGLNDFVIVCFLFISVLQCKGIVEIDNSIPEMKIIILLIAICGVWIPIGLLFGNASISECLKTFRNIIYIPATYALFLGRFNVKKNDRLIFMMSFVVALNTIANAVILYRQNNWFTYYRANGLLTITLLSYLLFLKDQDKKLVRYAAIILLLIASLLSQERIQIITIILTDIIVLFRRTISENKYSAQNIMNKIASLIFTVVLFGIVTYYIIKIPFIKNYFEYYYEYRLKSGALFRNNLSSDGSYAGRVFQIKSIVDIAFSNPLRFLFGSGTDAHYMAIQGETYIVDSTFLWIFKDIGIVGLILIIVAVCRGIAGSLKINNDHKYPMMAALITVGIFMIYNPTVLSSANTAFVVGFFLYVKAVYLKVENSDEINVRKCHGRILRNEYNSY